MTRPTACLLSLCIGLPVALPLGGCLSSHDEGAGSTEPGNPPVIAAALVRVEDRDDSVYVVGEAGAVTPGGAEIEVDNDSTGDSTRVTSEADGSFEASVQGDSSDDFSVGAVDAEGDATMSITQRSAVTTGSAGAGGAGTPSCECAPGLELRWREFTSINNPSHPTHVISAQCDVYEYRTYGQGEDCMQVLPACATSAIAEAFADPEVQAVFMEADEFYGNGQPAWEIMTDDTFLSLGQPCAPGDAGCREVTPALANLRDVLIAFADDHVGCQP